MSEADALNLSGGLTQNDFALFGLTPSFDLDKPMLERLRQSLLRQVHPDRFSAEGSAAQRIAMQWTVRINEAYARLKDPLSRATYLCHLNGVNTSARPTLSPDMLMQQMQWREELDEANASDVLALIQKAKSFFDQGLAQLHALCDQQAAWDDVLKHVQGLMFVQKFIQDVQARLDRDWDESLDV